MAPLVATVICNHRGLPSNLFPKSSGTVNTPLVTPTSGWDVLPSNAPPLAASRSKKPKVYRPLAGAPFNSRRPW